MHLTFKNLGAWLKQIRNSEKKPIYDSAAQTNRALEELIEVWRYRDLIYQLVYRDITARYKRSVLGIAWTMLNPLAMMLVLSVVFSHAFPGVPGYPAYVLSGLIAWNFFSQSTTAAINSLVWGGDLFRRIYLPRSVFALSSIGTGLVNLVLALVPYLAVSLVLGVKFSFALLVAPLAMLPLAFFALGVGLIISVVGIYFADVVEAYTVAQTIWFYATPIVYPLTMLPARIQKVLMINPLVYLVEFFRAPLYYNYFPSIKFWLLNFGISLLTLVIGWVVFAIKSDEFAYRT